MDHAQGRAFHHHLARAIMHWNYLAGLVLPFFEPSIEWDDPTLDQQFRTGRPSHASRSLHTFVLLPASSSPPTMVSHGGIPSHMIANPEPNLRPLTVARYPREDDEQNPSLDTITRNPVPTEGHTPTVPPGTLPAPDLPRATTRITTAVPVRSKQRATSTEDPQPKKKQRPASGPDPLPALFLFPSFQKSHVGVSIRMTLMMTQHPRLHPHMTTQLFPFLLLWGIFPLPCLCQVIMAHPSSYVSLPPDRSRSRDDPPMWSHPTPDRPRNPGHHESWNYTPLLRHTRRVLVIIDLEQVQHLMSARQSDVMQATTCDALPSLDMNSAHCSHTASW